MLPNTIVTIRQNAFNPFCAGQDLVSVRLSEGLRTLERRSFFASRIRRLVLPAGVEFLGEEAFCECTHLEHADLRAARLRELGERAFASCRKLCRALLGEGLEAIGAQCFSDSGLEELVVPSSVRRVGTFAFQRNMKLRQVRFLGAEGQLVPTAEQPVERPKAGPRTLLGRIF